MGYIDDLVHTENQAELDEKALQYLKRRTRRSDQESENDLD